VGSLLEIVRLLALLESNPDLKKLKRELKLSDDYGREIMAIIDNLIERLTLLLQVYHEYSYERRNRGLVGTQTNRIV
jgi:RNAse (barnase) inhibitor barstar